MAINITQFQKNFVLYLLTSFRKVYDLVQNLSVTSRSSFKELIDHNIFIMRQRQKQGTFRRSKRNFSDINDKFAQLKNLDDPYKEIKIARIKQNPIKINMSKLPPDFFPRTQSLRKKNFSTRQSIHQDRHQSRQPHRKAQSERNELSPQKTSFFGFFQQKTKENKKIISLFNSKRQFQSRDEPKREKIYLEQRNFTPMTGSHRADLLQMYPSIQDQGAFQAFATSKKLKSIHFSPKKESSSNIKKVPEFQFDDPERDEERKQNLKQIFNLGSSTEDARNITFFNAKSTSLPPIHKG